MKSKMSTQYEIVVTTQTHIAELLDIHEVSRYVDLHPEIIRRFVSLGLIDPVQQQPKLIFEVSVVPRIKKILRLRNDLGINLNGIGLIFDLLDKIAALEEEAAHYSMK